MDIKVTFTTVLKDENWGFSELINGRKFEECKEEILELLKEEYSSLLDECGIEIKLAFTP